jgi:DNA-directed RNA polymerase specialized sigma subunit
MNAYLGVIRRYPKLSLSEERQLISKAQKGSKKSKQELVLRHVGFLIYRIHKVAFPALAQRFGDDLLEEAILIIYKKIGSYNLDYRDKKGKPNPVKFTSYIWKRIDGFIIDSLRRELSESNYYDRFSSYAFKNGDLSTISTLMELDDIKI